MERFAVLSFENGGYFHLNDGINWFITVYKIIVTIFYLFFYCAFDFLDYGPCFKENLPLILIYKERLYIKKSNRHFLYIPVSQVINYEFNFQGIHEDPHCICNNQIKSNQNYSSVYIFTELCFYSNMQKCTSERLMLPWYLITLYRINHF